MTRRHTDWSGAYPWIVDPAEVRRRMRAAGGLLKLARETGIPKSTLHERSRQAPKIRGAAASGSVGEVPSVELTDDTLQIVSQKQRIVESLEPVDLIRGAGVDPAEWDWTFKSNVWEGPIAEGEVETFHQLTVHAKRIVPVEHVIPARESEYQRTVQRAKRTSDRPIVVALAGDQHAPHTDAGLHECWLAWLEANQPDRIIGLGDLGNYSKPSRHRANLASRFNDTPGECGQGGYDWWRDTLTAAGDGVEADQLLGNHDQRLQVAALEKLPDAYDVRRPGEEHPWWDCEYLYGLDQLAVTLHRPDGEYHHCEVEVAQGFTVTHGTTHGPTGGAHKAIQRHEGSRAIGHDHKQALTHVVRYRDGEAHVHVAVSVGTMARRDLGYTPDPDVQQGFGTLTVWPDGLWNVELARYDDRRKTLFWRDQRYTAGG